MELGVSDRQTQLMTKSLCSVFLIAITLAGCQGIPTGQPAAVLTDIPISRTPFSDVHINWKERLPQSYAYREVIGDYRLVQEKLTGFRTEAYRYGLTISGHAFALFYDDPGDTPIAQLRARMCLPVHAGDSTSGPWQFEVLPRSTVVYAAVGGAPSSVPLAYPAMFSYLEGNGWVLSGPIREIYMADPKLDKRIQESLTEVQLPWSPAR